jgi:hypothetical protein
MKGPHFESARTGAASKDDWCTPMPVVAALGRLFGEFRVDAAATAESNVARGWRHYGVDGRYRWKSSRPEGSSGRLPAVFFHHGHERLSEADALANEPWWREPTFLNPPYSKLLPFIRRVVQAVTVDEVPSVVTLTAARTDTRAWSLLMKHATEIILVSGRIRFWRPDGSGPILDAKGRPVGAPFPSAVALWTGRPGGPRVYQMTREELGS